MLFIGALNRMVELYKMAGNTGKAESYSQLLNTAVIKYDQTYWDDEKGRYISTINQNDEALDYGLTFLNTEALFYGAGNQQKADKIFSWIDGERLIEGDTAQGLQILDKWKIGPMVNTIPIESVVKLNPETGRNIAWWHVPAAINVFSNASFTEHCENGGAIFYTTYFELMSRIKYGKTDSAMQRMITIAREYGIDELLRDPPNRFGAAWVLGIIGEFPESGLVPTVFLKGFMGVNATGRGLEIKPSIPQEYTYMGSKNVSYGGKVYTVKVTKNESIELLAGDLSTSNFDLYFSDFANKNSYTVVITDENGVVTDTKTAQLQADGTYKVNLTVSGKSKITVN